MKTMFVLMIATLFVVIVCFAGMVFNLSTLVEIMVIVLGVVTLVAFIACLVDLLRHHD